MFLLDTCTLLWLASESSRISPVVLEHIHNTEQLFVSAVSALEIGIKIQKRRLSITIENIDQWFAETIEQHQCTDLPITSHIAALSTQLQTIHFDPSDRILIATAQLHDLTILTPDENIRRYPKVKTVW